MRFHRVLTAGMILFSLVLASCETGKSTGPSSDEYTTVTILVKDELGRTVSSAPITTNPPTEEIVTDSEGKAVFTNMLVKQYAFYVRRPGYPAYSQIITINSKSTEPITLVVETLTPKVNISFPTNDKFVSIYDIRFTGTAFDAEDGVLPDSTCIWYSNIDGEIGRGKNIVLDILTLGTHNITLEATDSDNKKSSATVQIKLVDYYPDSYFPLPRGAHWIYHHKLEQFSILNESGYIENWTLYNIEVDIDDNNQRISNMTYKVKVLNRTREYQYTVIDDIEKDSGNIYVKKTSENLQMWNGNPLGTPSEELNITTAYDPHYLLVKNTRNPGDTSSFETKMGAIVSWIYKDPFFGPKEFTEHFDVITSVTIGDVETLETSWGELNTIPLTITQQESVRKWWLAPGLGIVKLTYNSFKMPPSANLLVSNLTAYSNKNTVTLKNAAEVYTNYQSPQLNTEPIPAEDSFERMKALRNILKNISPR